MSSGRIISKKHFCWWLCHAFMSIALDSPSVCPSFDWGNVSVDEWNECFVDLVHQSKNSLDKIENTSVDDQALEDVVSLEPIPSGGSEDTKKKKIQQLVLLQEVWARTGTNREAFYQSLFLLQSMKILDLNEIDPVLYSALQNESESTLTGSGSLVQPIPVCNASSCYDIVEKALEMLPNNIPLLMTPDSPLSNLLRILSKENSRPEPLTRSKGKLVSLLKQSRFLTDFEPLGFIGKGGFGTVLKARNKSEDFPYAIKVVRFSDFAVPSKRFQRVFREVTTLARLDHVNVVRYYSAWLELTEEYKEMLRHLDPPTVNDGETPPSSFDSQETITEEDSYSGDEFGVEDYLEDDMSSMSILVPYDEADDVTLEPASPDSPVPSSVKVFDDNDTAINIYGGGSVEIGFKGRKNKDKKRRESMFTRPQLWRAESSSQIPRVSSSNVNRSLHRAKTRRSLAKTSKTQKSHRILTGNPISVATNCTTSIHAEQFDYTLFIQMQLYEYDTLKQWLSNPNRVIDKKENLRIFSQMVSGLKHVHEHGLLHRDLKPANIFMSKDGIVKIGDFGLSRDLDNPTPIVASDLASIIKKPNLKICTAVDDNLASSGNKTSSVGTPGYVAPEILNSDCYGPKVDVYSLGIMLMELFTKTSTKHEKGMNLMRLRDRTVPSEIEHKFPDLARLILAMTEPNPDERISLDEVEQIVESALDDYQHLRKQISEQDKKIKEQQVQLELLARENAALKAKLAHLSKECK
mmetsp:Transcript_5275/g.6420  ORF Transcript_5275/g.6420 Transcript_5275/m.6420 type:complete len:748 (-) Transcript_5275:14-2257(-)